MFTSIFEKSGGLTLYSAVLCTAASILLGLVVALIYMINNRSNRSYCVALVLLPVIVQVVIMMVNGEIGTGVAVMGAFSLIRFRSVPGRAIDICCIFFAMAIGIATGMGYIAFAAFVTVVVGILLLILTKLNFGGGSSRRELRITVPEDIDYTEIFDDVFRQYTSEHELVRVKAGNANDNYEVRYHITFKRKANAKEFIDRIREKNGNMSVILCSDDPKASELM